MTKYNEPEFKVVISKTEDVLTASPFLEAGGSDNMESDVVPLITISG